MKAGNRTVFRLEGQEGRPVVLRLAGWEEMFGGVTAGISTRLGGVSAGPYRSLNGAFHVGDDPACVLENRRRVCEAAGMPFESLTCAEQVHGRFVAVVGERDRGRGRVSRDDALGEYDALVTRTPGIMLAAFYADCVPIWLFDPVGRSVGLAHAGWRGTAANVAGRTLETMVLAFGARPGNVRAAIGPAIGGCCYIVDEPVVDRIGALFGHFGEMPADVICPVTPGSDAFRLDLKNLNRWLLIKAGILPSNIEISDWCTGCRTDLWYSHRREQGRTGRMTAWIALTDRTGGSER